MNNNNNSSGDNNDGFDGEDEESTFFKIIVHPRANNNNSRIDVLRINSVEIVVAKKTKEWTVVWFFSTAAVANNDYDKLVVLVDMDLLDSQTKQKAHC